MHLLGATPARVYATGSAFHPDLVKINSFFESAQCNLEFSSGVCATIELSRSSPYGYDQRIEVRTHASKQKVEGVDRRALVWMLTGPGFSTHTQVFGSKGMVQLTNLPRTQVVVSSPHGTAHDNPVHSFPQRFAEAYVLEVDEFSDVMAGTKPPSVTVADSVNATRVAEACRFSASKGQPVALSEVP